MTTEHRPNGSRRGAASVATYGHFRDLWHDYDQMLIHLARRAGASVVAELGGGANPIVANEDHWGFVRDRVVLDISADEMAKAPAGVRTQVADLCQPVTGADEAYDLVFSKMLVEHIWDPMTFHRNCFDLLRPGGRAAHFFPTISTLPFAINRAMPEDLARKLLQGVQPHRISDPNQEKFPAFYRWCTGPTPTAFRRFEALGFEVESWRAGFGHAYYRRVAPLHHVEALKTRFLQRHPSPYLTSFSMVVLRKPDERALARTTTSAA